MPALSTLAMIGLGLSAIGTGASVVQGMSSADQQKKANATAAANAQKSLALETDQINKANAKSPDTASIVSQNQNAAKGGAAGTLLTGVGGVAPTSLNLGRTTLLGQ